MPIPADLDWAKLSSNIRRAVAVLLSRDKHELSKLLRWGKAEYLLEELDRYPKTITGVAPDFERSLHQHVLIKEQGRVVHVDVDLWSGDQRTDLTLQVRSRLGDQSEIEVFDLLVM